MNQLLHQLPWILLGYALLLAPMGLFYAIIRIWEHKHHKRRSPITRYLPRQAGHSVRVKLLDIRMELIASAFGILVIPHVMAAMAYWMHEPRPQFPPTPAQAAIASLGLASVGLLTWRMWRLMNEVRSHNLGLDGEIYVGAALGRLAEFGCRIFHDVPIAYGNIDHVVVSKSGVFTVETKILGKRHDLKGDATVVVDFEANQLRFPDRTTQIPLQQPRMQAKVLGEILTSAIGEEVRVEPMLALPGWMVQRKGKSDVCVLNPLNATGFFVNSRTVHSPQMIQRIAHHLEQMTTDVEPVYRKSGSWNQ